MAIDPAHNIIYHVGLVTLLWARLEGKLDAINHAIFNFGGGAAVEPEVPQALDRKLKFMRKAHKVLPLIRQFREDADKLADQVHALKHARHDVIHGMALAPPFDGILRVLAIKRSKISPRGIDARNVEMNVTRLAAIAEKILYLDDIAAAHFDAILAAVFSNDCQDLQGGNLD